MARILGSEELAKRVIADTTERVKVLKAKGAKPGLAFVIVGDNKASHTYVSLKRKLCAKVGVESHLINLPAEASTTEVIDKVMDINEDPAWHALLVQLPLPEGVNTTAVLRSIDPRKDVDGLHPLNQGLLASGIETQTIPCTPLGCMLLIKEAGIDLPGKHATVVGRSRIVGRPMASLLANAGATVTVCHSKTADLAAECRKADVLVVAAGKVGLIDGSMVKEGAVVIDVGINHVNGGIVGDVDTDSVAKAASAVTPVPGGVGPMTLAMLMQNTVDLVENHVAAKEKAS